MSRVCCQHDNEIGRCKECRAVRLPIFVAVHFDSEDKQCRVAGVYTRRASADRCIKRLGNGWVQALTLNKAVKLLVRGGP